VTPEVALPTGLGTVEVGAVQVGPLVVGTSSGSCSTEANTVYADVRLELSKEANPWRDLLEYETLVNGKRVVMSESINVGPQPWMSWVGRGKDRLYALCGDSHGFEGVGPGRHSVQFRARVAGTETVVLSEEATLELVCPGQSLPVLEEVLPDAQVPPSGSACGCATSQTLGWAWALALVGVVVRRRSRGQPTRGPDIASADQEVIDAHP